VNAGKTKYMEIRHHRGMMAKGHITVRVIQVKNYKYLGSLLSNQNSVQ